jgi:hypothetical protein
MTAEPFRIHEAGVSFLIVALAIATLYGLAACSSYGIKSPANGATLPNAPVAFQIDWTPSGSINNFTATLDGADRTASFAIGDSSGTASLSVSAGSHTFSSTADVYDPLYRKYIARSGTVTFTVQGPPPPSFSLSTPPTLTIVRGSTGNLTVTVTRSNGFTAPVQVSASSLPTGVTSGTAMVARGQTSGVLVFSASSGAAFGSDGSPCEVTAVALPARPILTCASRARPGLSHGRRLL